MGVICNSETRVGDRNQYKGLLRYLINNKFNKLHFDREFSRQTIGRQYHTVIHGATFKTLYKEAN